MRLFIAEKPDLAKAIVEGLGGGSRKDGYFDCGGDWVTWCFGHMLQLLDPEDYDHKYAKWSLDDLPMQFVPWRKKPAPDKVSHCSPTHCIRFYLDFSHRFIGNRMGIADTLPKVPDRITRILPVAPRA